MRFGRAGAMKTRGKRVVDFAEQFNQQYGYVKARRTAVPDLDTQRRPFPSDEGGELPRQRRLEDESPAGRLDLHHRVSTTSAREDGPCSFPTEVVGYLKKLLADTGGNMDSLISTRCLAECAGLEDSLCRYQESSRIVEALFSPSPTASLAFLVAISRLRHARQLDLLGLGCASRTMETLLWAVKPLVGDPQAIALLEHFKQLIVDNWEMITASNCALHFVRSLARLTAGLPRESHAKSPAHNEKKKEKGANAQLNAICKEIVVRALDFEMMKDWICDEASSCLMQDAVDCDVALRLRCARAFVLAAVDADADEVRVACCDKQGSRLWQKLVVAVDEETRQHLMHALFAPGHLKTLAVDDYGNFVLQGFISSASSLELINDIFEQLEGQVEAITSAGRWGVMRALARCVRHAEPLQTAFLKRLRLLFACHRGETRAGFVPCVLRLTPADASHASTVFNIAEIQLQGSLLLQELLHLHHNKTLLASLASMSDDELCSLARNAIGSHVLDAFFDSRTVPEIARRRMIAILEKHGWHELVRDKYGSRVFETIWRQLPIDEKERVMGKVMAALAGAQQKTPIARLMLNVKLLAGLYMSNRAQWRLQMKTR